MAKNWWFKFDFKTWRTDSDLRRCSFETRAIWLEMICVMHETETYELTGSYQELARLIGCESNELARTVAELKRTETADVTLGNGTVTVMSRRLKRELSGREQTRLRVQKHRCNGDVTVQSKSNKKEVRSKKKEEEREEAATPPSPVIESEAVSAYFETFPTQAINLYQQELITDRVSDFIRWRAVLREWKSNGWQARNVGNILDRYDAFTEREKKYGSPQRPPTAAERNWERTVANEQLGEDIRSGKLNDFFAELHRRDPLYRHEVPHASQPPAALTGGFGDNDEGLDGFLEADHTGESFS